MSVRQDGTTRCDRCGKDLGNGAQTRCVLIAGIDAGGGRLLLHLCTTPGGVDPYLTPSCAASTFQGVFADWLHADGRDGTPIDFYAPPQPAT